MITLDMKMPTIKKKKKTADSHELEGSVRNKNIRRRKPLVVPPLYDPPFLTMSMISPLLPRKSLSVCSSSIVPGINLAVMRGILFELCALLEILLDD
mmetsp:Transcript_21918/g.45042  ORF Transcript_21918/g.45042 Transcript_21918/m.45042 type:complete len:97 (+) Transcript_21918:1299-1589(+)